MPSQGETALTEHTIWIVKIARPGGLIDVCWRPTEADAKEVIRQLLEEYGKRKQAATLGGPAGLPLLYAFPISDSLMPTNQLFGAL